MGAGGVAAAVHGCQDPGAGSAGVRNLLAVPISFVSEHIETLEEIDMEYRELALESGIQVNHKFKSITLHPGGDDMVLRAPALESGIQVRSAAAVPSSMISSMMFGKGGGKYATCSSNVQQCGLLGLRERGKSKASGAAQACWPLTLPPCVVMTRRQRFAANFAALSWCPNWRRDWRVPCPHAELQGWPVQLCRLVTYDLAAMCRTGGGFPR